MTPARPLLATAAGLALAGLLTSCSQEAPSAPAPAATAAAGAPTAASDQSAHHEHGAGSHEEVATPPATPTSTSVVPVPEQDERARVADETGASLFSAYFLRVLNHDRAAGDSTLLRSISAESCTGCTFYADVIDEYRAKGYTTPQFVLQFTGTSIDAWDPPSGSARLTVTVDRPAYNTLDRNGSIISSDEAAPGSEFWIDLVWQQDHWKAKEVE